MGEAVVITGSNSGSEGLQVARSIGQEKETVGEKGERNSIMDVNKKNESGGGGGGVCNNMKSGNTNGAVKWDRLFPKMALRVLLVEADDSTRHIIAALLKKCCYRVAAVPDGLKAWEMLKGRPHNIDLILTEVDLPAISGYALLTLIMEHDICKNIPVIMMSSHNSISTVYKCMMRGACDYLVKPVRKNELRNLWQHVWRKRSSLAGGISPQDESVGQDKAEATSENNAASNNSAGAQKSKECAEKESDAQSSCTKPEVEAESSPVEYVQDSELPASGNLSTNAKMHSQEMHTYFGHKFPFDERETRALADPKESITVAVGNIVEQQGHRIDANIHGEASENYPVHVSREAIDFMGASTKHISSPNNTQTKFDFSPHLDLTLRRSNPIGFEIQGSEERRTLRHSDASAFTRYTNRSPHTPHSTSASICDEKELGDKLERRLCCNMGSHLSDKLSTSPRGQRSVISLVNAPKESELAKSCARERIFPIQIPVEGVNYNTMGTNYASTFPAVFSRHAVVSPTPSPSSASQPESLLRANSFHQSNFNSNSEHFYEWRVQNAHDSTSQGMQKHERRLNTAEDQGQISPATDQSANSSFCNGVTSHLNSIGYGSASGSNSNIDRVAMAMAAAENKNGEVTFAQNVSSHRSIQREAALNKFRMKRKERCYEKKVRYESRKKLAEQRPRVKGQFVRQVQADPLYSEPK